MALACVSKERSFSAGLAHGRCARAARPSLPAEDFEGFDPSGEVVDLDRSKARK
jgi:hypothetical protein